MLHRFRPTGNRDQRGGTAATTSWERSTAAPEDHISHLAIMRELAGFHLADGQIDVRHWPVFTSDSRLVGAIDRLMVETTTRRIRYACVSLIHHAASDRRPTPTGYVLVPVGLMRRLDDRNIVVLDALTSESVVKAPRIRMRPVTRGDEQATLVTYGLPASADGRGNGFYASPHFDEDPLLLAAATGGAASGCQRAAHPADRGAEV
jgi:hypothetical protein